MKKILALLFLSICTYAQSVEITPGNILPQVTTAQRNAIASPKNGMLVFDTNTQSYWFRQSGSWTELPKGGSTANYWQLTGNVINNTNSGGYWSANPTGLIDNATNLSNPPIAPVSGDGTRLMWIPSRSAFRVGTVTSNAKSWDADSIGLFSTAMGINTKARGVFSTAIGRNTIASGYSSTAIGNSNRARGSSSIAMGAETSAFGEYSTSMGLFTTASGIFSTAMGLNTRASGNSSTAMGSNTTASGLGSTAIGTAAIASGDNSTAMGHRINAGGKGSFIIGDFVSDFNEPPRSQNTDNRFTARFRGGYWFMTTGNSLNPANENDGVLGARLEPNSTAWAAISDSTKKENFLKANGEEFLTKLSKLKLGSWNYKGNETRNYGPMAQEIFTAFGQDKLGTIGSDTLVNTLDMDGLLFIFAQALQEKTEKLKVNSEKLKMKNEQLEASLNQTQSNIEKLTVNNEKLTVKNEQLEAHISTLSSEITRIKEQFKTLLQQNPETKGKLLSQTD